MKAYVLHGIGDLRYEESEKPQLTKDSVLLKVMAMGVCGSDIPRIYQTGTYSFPLIPGHEFSGVVEEIGENVAEPLLGKRVGVFPLIPCGKCEPCQNRQYELCRSYSYLGSRTDGGFAEYARVPAGNLLLLPDNVTFEQAAMLEPMAVAVHAMRRVSITPKTTVAICGQGTIGLLLLMFLRERGVQELYVIGNKEVQKQAALTMGAEEARCLFERGADAGEWLLARTGGRGVDVFFDCVGKQEVVSQGISAVAPGGSVLLMGNPASDMALGKQIYWKILRNQLTLVGTWNSSFTNEETDDWHYVLKRLREGRIHPERLITHRLEFDRFAEGIELARDKKEPYIKVMGQK